MLLLFAVFIFGHFQSQARNGLKTCDMGNWEKKQEEKAERKDRDKVSRETLGKFFYDLAKLVFTAMALVGGVSLIVDEPQIKQGILLVTGMFLTYIFASIGYNILK